MHSLCYEFQTESCEAMTEYLQEEIDTAVLVLERRGPPCICADDLCESEAFISLIERCSDKYDLKATSVGALLHMGIVIGLELEKVRKVTQ
jgi:hypothetical protein